MNEIIKEEFNKYQEPFVLGRVTTVHKTHYVCESNQEIYHCTVSGRFKYLSYQKSDYPVVGDYVIFIPSEYDTSGVIEKVCTRVSKLSRLGVTKTEEEQLLASNIDLVFVCMSLNLDFNLRKLRRLLSLGYNSGAETIILLTKSDLTDDIETYVDLVKSIDKKSKILITSSKDTQSMDRIYTMLEQKTGVFFR